MVLGRRWDVCLKDRVAMILKNDILKNSSQGLIDCGVLEVMEKNTAGNNIQPQRNKSRL